MTSSMASFKGDSYYKAHVERDPASEEEESYTDMYGEEYIQKHVEWTYRAWIIENKEVLEQLFHRFTQDGRSVFGSSFWQLGSFHDFAKVLFKYTQPGAL